MITAVDLKNMEMIPPKYWGSFNNKKKENNSYKIRTLAEKEALIVNLITETFPEILTCPEKRFISFQEKLSRLL